MSERKAELWSRRRLLQAGCGGLGLALIGAAPRRGYEAITVAGPARISGRVRSLAKAGRPPRLKLSGDCDYCRKFHPRSEALLQNTDGSLRNAVVYLSGIERGKAPAAEVPTMAELRCTFTPHVVTMQVGKLRLVNQDPVLNTFHATELATGRTLFNIGMPQKGQKALRRIRRPGVIRMLCDVHPWEVGYVLAFPHPYHTITDGEGRFTLDQVPPGSYTLTLWHEQLGQQTKKIKLAAGDHLRLELTYPAAKG